VNGGCQETGPAEQNGGERESDGDYHEKIGSGNHRKGTESDDGAWRHDEWASPLDCEEVSHALSTRKGVVGAPRKM
jgi:hypothetical protein